jgi:hypothetical protein
MQTKLLIIAGLLLLAWFLLRLRKPAQKEATPKTEPRPGSAAYHAVSIRLGQQACEAAQAMSGRRFLSSAAPRLPLADCNAAQCNCRFVHHNDRRSGKDRRSPFASGGFGGGTGSFETERRERPDRREDADTDLF